MCNFLCRVRGAHATDLMEILLKLHMNLEMTTMILKINSFWLKHDLLANHPGNIAEQSLYEVDHQAHHPGAGNNEHAKHSD